ncbi:hypothetical protein JAO29_06005 [Edaphobacter sp. HDX4]|uniref:hypothetical protein n=1 Tax=Edaphobacter sp. HDX4 TaxID=2794064 RepID=UPI002FE50C86
MSFSSVVIDIREERRTEGRQQWQLLLEGGEFRAGDTGLLEVIARSGARLSVPVLNVLEEDGEVWLRVEKPLTAGTQVTGQVERKQM